MFIVAIADLLDRTVLNGNPCQRDFRCPTTCRPCPTLPDEQASRPPAAPAIRPRHDQRVRRARLNPLPARQRHDGWTPARQVSFLRALAETACVDEAAQAVGMSARSAYLLKSRPDAGSFRQAWNIALDFAAGRLADAVLGRALNGEVTPIFFQGEQVGERRRYDNRLAMWVLRLRQPERYGRWREGLRASRDHPDGGAMMMADAIGRVAEDAQADATGQPRPVRPPLHAAKMTDDPDFVATQDEMRRRHADDRLARYHAMGTDQLHGWEDGQPPHPVRT